MEEIDPQPALEDGERYLQPGKKWPVDIDVYLYDDTDPNGFEIVTILPIDKSDPERPCLIFENKGRPGFKLLFHLHDLTDQNYRFPENVDDAVWSIAGETGCPTSRVHEVFVPVRVTNNGTVLVVDNDNDEKDGKPIGKFRYTLNVTKTGREPYLPLDPGGDNQDGPRTMRFR